MVYIKVAAPYYRDKKRIVIDWHLMPMSSKSTIIHISNVVKDILCDA